MPFSPQARIEVSEDTLVQESSGEIVILSLATEAYYGLDDSGARMWSVLTGAGSIGEACETLLEEYDVDGEILRRDVERFVEDLAGQQLIEIVDG